jgi:hypothetical protein
MTGYLTVIGLSLFVIGCGASLPTAPTSSASVVVSPLSINPQPPIPPTLPPPRDPNDPLPLEQLPDRATAIPPAPMDDAELQLTARRCGHSRTTLWRCF